jgi:hypothetical protein
LYHGFISHEKVLWKNLGLNGRGQGNDEVMVKVNIPPPVAQLHSSHLYLTVVGK